MPCHILSQHVASVTYAVTATVTCLLATSVCVTFRVTTGESSASTSSVMLQELSHMDRITQLQDEIQQVLSCLN